jgi:hypothetical protein
MSKSIGILALLWTGLLSARPSNRTPVQTGVYSTLYNGGSEYRYAENCLKGIVVPYTAFTTTNLTPGQLTLRVCGVTLP